MTKMRLTTLNLDQDCLDILGEAKNKSAKARECIRMYDRVAQDLEDEMRRRDQMERGIDVFAAMITDAYNRNADLDSLLSDLLDITSHQVAQTYENNYMEAAIKSAVYRRGRF